VRVLFPFVGDSVGGSHRSILELHYALKEKNITSIFVLHEIGPLSELFDSLNVEYKYIYTRYLAGESPSLLKIAFSIAANFIKLSRFIRKNRIDIVHGNDLRVNLTWSLPTKFSNSVYLWHQRSLMSPSVLWNASAVLADYFITISKYVDQSLPGNISRIKRTLILNPFNTKDTYDRITSRKWLNMCYKIPEDVILLGYIGRLVEWKNVDFLIKCFSKYTDESDLHLHLIIVGTGKNKYIEILKELACKASVRNTITFAGFNSEPNKVISAFDLMIAPSNQEPFGRTLVEAMIQKTPILAAKGGGHSEIINHGVTGRLYNHYDMKDFTDQCNICLGTDNLEIVNQANFVASSRYSSCQHVESIMHVYKKLLAI
jgi:glycosyltransferase involved in cell wall biosynthesis